MRRTAIFALILMALLSACAVVPAGRHGELELVPLLPPVVVFDTDPYYVHGGFYYHYDNDAWFYSRSRSGPWLDLPRAHYPREVRFRGHEGWRGDRGRRR
jgi:hypothetical protein